MDKIPVAIICPQCGALIAPGASHCSYCGAAVVPAGGSHGVVLQASGNHPSLLLGELQTFADDLFSQGRGRNAAALVKTINGLTFLLRGGRGAEGPVLLFETDDAAEAERLVKKIEETGGTVTMK